MGGPLPTPTHMDAAGSGPGGHTRQCFLGLHHVVLPWVKKGKGFFKGRNGKGREWAFLAEIRVSDPQGSHA